MNLKPACKLLAMVFVLTSAAVASEPPAPPPYPSLEPPLDRNVSFDGTYVLIGNQLWNIKTGQKIRQFATPPGATYENGVKHGFGFVAGATLSRNGGMAITVTQEALELGEGFYLGPVQVWDTRTGRELINVKPNDELTTGIIQDAQFSPNGKLFLTASEYYVVIWDTSTGKLILRIQGLWMPSVGEPAGWCASFSPDGTKLLLLGHDQATIYASHTGKQICITHEDQKPRSYLTFAEFSPDGKYFLTVYANRCTKIWDANTGQLIQSFSEPDHNQGGASPYALFVPGGKSVISGSDDATAILWDLKSGEKIREFKTPGSNLAPIKRMALNRDGKRLITISVRSIPSQDRAIALWDVDSGQLIQQFAQDEEVAGFSPDGSAFLTLKGGKPFALYDAATGKVMRKYEGN